MTSARPFHPAQDFNALLKLREVVENHDRDGVELGEAALRQQMSWPGHDPAHDRWVMDAPDQPGVLAAHGLAWRPQQSSAARLHIIVAPQHRRQGLGNTLWRMLVNRAREQGATSTASYVNGLNQAANAFLLAQGCHLDWPYVEMRRTLSEPPPACLPQGFTVQTYAEIQDLSLLTRAMNAAYAGQAGHQEVDEDEMAGWLPGFSEQGLLLLFAPDHAVAGISRTEVSADRSTANGCSTGYIDAPGILPAFRSPQAYRGLLRAGLRGLADQGCIQVELEGWGEPAERLAMYHEEGFTLLKSINAYSSVIP